jgi:DNA replication protein DnaC
MTEMFNRTIAAAERMNLVDISDTLDSIVSSATDHTWSYLKFTCELLEEQARRAEIRSRDTLLRFASFPYQKTLEDFDFSFQKSVSQRMLKELSECGFLREKQNLVFLGPPGTGKTHLAVALGVAATKLRYRVKFTTLSTLITKLSESKERNTYSRRLSAYSRPSLLIIDEVGFTPLNPDEAALLFDVICRRYEKGSVILTSNKSYSEWAEIFSDNAVLATAILDRLLHHSKTFVLRGESYRMKEVKAEKA